MNTASKVSVKLAVSVLDQERELSCAITEVHQQIPCLLSDPGAVWVRGDAQKVDAAVGVLHDEQDVESVQQQGVDAEEVGGKNAVCLGGQGLSPGGAVAAGCGSMPARFGSTTPCWVQLGSRVRRVRPESVGSPRSSSEASRRISWRSSDAVDRPLGRQGWVQCRLTSHDASATPRPA